jgi:aspartyl-tRNA(Asn)/glutamyl-tRNA(Gln) amidotransferase subunit A
MSAPDLLDLSIAELAPLLRDGTASPVEVTHATLDRIAKVDGHLNSFIAVTADQAIAAARRAEAEIAAGGWRGPLHGVPIALKDLFNTAGVVTTNGSRIFKDTVPAADAVVTAKLTQAGAVIVGKNNMHEFAFGSTTNNPHFGPCRNAWNQEHIPGGSSGGSGAAVAARLCFMSMGSDTGGSVRSPACLNGIVGHKPTYGLVSRRGVFPLSWSLDHAGPLARTVRDAALTLQVIAGHDPADPSSASSPIPDYSAALDGDVRGLRVGVPREYFFARASEEVETHVRAAIRTLEGLGATIVEVSLPHVALGPTAGMTIISVEAAEVHTPWLRTRPSDYGADVRPRLQAGALFSGVEYTRAQRIRTLMQQEFRDAMTRADVLAMPTNAIPAPRLDQTMIPVRGAEVWVMALMPSLTIPHNLTGAPALTVPCGFAASGLPIGLQIVGRPFEDATVLRVGHAYEQATDWHRRRPAI